MASEHVPLAFRIVSELHRLQALFGRKPSKLTGFETYNMQYPMQDINANDRRKWRYINDV